MAEVYQIARKQDLPPPGGYKPIPFKRIPAKAYFSGKQCLFTTINACIYYVT